MIQPYIESATALSDMDISPNHITPARACTCRVIRQLVDMESTSSIQDQYYVILNLT